MASSVTSAEFSALEKRVQKLESNSNYFGKSFSNVGDVSSDLLLRTRGNIKIQMGRKFIDLLKDGKINVETEFIYEAEEVGNKDGIYVIGDEVILKIGDTEITLASSDIGTTYVSFLAGQETDSDSKYNALVNIGFLYSSLDDVDTSALLNGIIYVESTLTLYIVLDGVLTAYSFEFPNPFTSQFVISKTTSEDGALVITGEGTANSLMFDTFMLYTEDGTSYFDSEGTISIKVNDIERIRITNSLIVMLYPVVADTILSSNASSTSGFRLYYVDGESTLEVDNLIVRNSSTEDVIHPIYPTLWFCELNIILSITAVDEAEDDDINAEDTTYQVICTYTSLFLSGDILYAYIDVEDELELVTLTITSSDEESTEEDDDNDDENTIYTVLTCTITGNISSLTSDELISALKGKAVFLVGRTGSITVTRIGPSGLDLVNSSSSDDELNVNNITTRIGNIEELGLTGNVDGETEEITGTGIYSNNAAFLVALYVSGYVLEDDDNSSKFTSTEWVNKKSGYNALQVPDNSYSHEIAAGELTIYFNKDEDTADYVVLEGSLTENTEEQSGGPTVTIGLQYDNLYSAIKTSLEEDGFGTSGTSESYWVLDGSGLYAGDTTPIYDVYGVSFWETSDAKLKSQITPISPTELIKANNIKIKSFIKNNRKEYGVVALEVEEAGFPNLVSNREYKSVDYISLLSLKVARLEEENKVLKKRLDNLESIILELHGRNSISK